MYIGFWVWGQDPSVSASPPSGSEICRSPQSAAAFIRRSILVHFRYIKQYVLALLDFLISKLKGKVTEKRDRERELLLVGSLLKWPHRAGTGPVWSQEPRDSFGSPLSVSAGSMALGLACASAGTLAEGGLEVSCASWASAPQFCHKAKAEAYLLGQVPAPGQRPVLCGRCLESVHLALFPLLMTSWTQPQLSPLCCLLLLA